MQGSTILQCSIVHSLLKVQIIYQVQLEVRLDISHAVHGMIHTKYSDYLRAMKNIQILMTHIIIILTASYS